MYFFILIFDGKVTTVKMKGKYEYDFDLLSSESNAGFDNAGLEVVVTFQTDYDLDSAEFKELLAKLMPKYLVMAE